MFGDPELEEISNDDLAGEYSVLRYVPPSGDHAINMIARLGQAFAFEDLDWDPVERDGVTIRVATPSTLYRMKVDTVRRRTTLMRPAFAIESDSKTLDAGHEASQHRAARPPRS